MRDNVLKKWFTDALEAENVSLIVELDKLLAQTPKYYNDYEKIKENFDKVQENQRGAGNKIKSLTDSGEI